MRINPVTRVDTVTAIGRRIVQSRDSQERPGCECTPPSSINGTPMSTTFPYEIRKDEGLDFEEKQDVAKRRRHFCDIATPTQRGCVSCGLLPWCAKAADRAVNDGRKIWRRDGKAGRCLMIQIKV